MQFQFIYLREIAPIIRLLMKRFKHQLVAISIKTDVSTTFFLPIFRFNSNLSCHLTSRKLFKLYSISELNPEIVALSRSFHLVNL